MADQKVVGKTGRVTGRIGPDRLGEVMIPIRGGTEAFHAYAFATIRQCGAVPGRLVHSVAASHGSFGHCGGGQHPVSTKSFALEFPSARVCKCARSGFSSALCV